MDVALHGQTLNLFPVTSVQHDARQTLQRATTNTQTSDMANVVAIALYKTGTSTHRHHDGLVEPALKTGSQSVGNELVDLLSRYAINGLVDIGSTYACQHHLLDVCERYLVVVQILTKGAVERCHLVGSCDTDGREYSSVA